MAVYETLNNNVNNIIDFIVNNDELKLLLYYADSEALSKSVGNVDISLLLKNNIYPYANIPDVNDDAKSLINIYMYNGKNAGRDNVFQHTIQMFVDVICHETLWKLDSGIIRTYKMLDVLDKNLSVLETDSIRGNLSHIDTVYISYNKKFCGYRLIYTLSNHSRECFD